MKLLSLVLFVTLALTSVTATNRKLACYFQSWARYRIGQGQFGVENVDASLCSHLMYAFLGVNPDGSLQIIDHWADVEDGGFMKFNALRNQNPELKTLIAVGGATVPSYIFSAVVGDPTLRATFVTNLYNFVKEWGFNGLDLDWEYPRANDKENFAILCEELQEKFAPEGLLLTAAVSANSQAIAIGYDVHRLSKSLDHINLMTYDYHGAWEPITGINSPLYSASIDTDLTLNADYTVRDWLNNGAPASKLLIGGGLYGRSFTLADSNSPGLGAQIKGVGQPGPFMNAPGILGYNEICHMKYPGGYSPNWAAQQMVPFAFRGDQWVGFDNVRSVEIKAQYVKDMGLGGMMTWSIDLDDYHNICGQGPMALTKKIKEVLNS